MVSSCPTCGKTFKKAKAVEKHLQQGTHAAFKCPACVLYFLEETSVATVRHPTYNDPSTVAQQTKYIALREHAPSRLCFPLPLV